MLQTNGVTESDVKEVIKTLLENATRQKGGEKNKKKNKNKKNANDVNDRINTTNVD